MVLAVTVDLPLRNGPKAAEIQGDILAGLNKDFRSYLFLEFPDQEKGRAWLQEVIPYVSMTNEVAPFNEAFKVAYRMKHGEDPTHLRATWVNISFTYPGLKLLLKVDPTPTMQANGIASFVKGPLDATIIKGNGDSGSSDPKNWVVGKASQTIHAMLNVQSDTEYDLTDQVQELKAICSKHSVNVVFQQNGATLTGNLKGHEHFGYKDGISQPGVAGFDPADPDAKVSDPTAKLGVVKDHPGTEIIAAGEFILGEPDENGNIFAVPGLEWMQNGTFQVFRRLNQDVAGFNKQQVDVARSLPANHPLHDQERLGAKLVGRWKSGTPVDLSPNVNDHPEDNSNNDFDYMHESSPGVLQADTLGLRCPRIAHIRKVYPRQQDFAHSRIRRIIRRGVPFGLEFDPAKGGGYDENSERGLLFVAYMSSIEKHFEFLMGAWVNNAKFPSATIFPDGDPAVTPGPDPIIAQNQPVENDVLHIDTQPANDVTKTFEGFVHTTGTMYGFVPSRTTLEGLANGTL